VLEVLDRPSDARFTLAEMELLGLFANQAAVALDLLQRARRARATVEGRGELEALARLATALEDRRDEDDDKSRRAVLELLAALEKVL
jgi:GAF domain-containing protein